MVKKKLLIIGGSSGIGKYLTKKLNDNFEIYSSFNKNTILSKNIKTFHLDLSQDNQNVINSLKKIKIIPDSLIYLPGGSLNFKKYEYDIDSWKYMLNINTIKFIEIMNHYLPFFQKKKYARVVCFSSTAIKDSQANIPYSCSKALLEEYVKKAGRRFAGDNIFINCIRTSIISYKNNNWYKAKINNEKFVADVIKKNISVNKIGTPEDLIPYISHLISHKNKFSTGTIYNVDGGLK